MDNMNQVKPSLISNPSSTSRSFEDIKDVPVSFDEGIIRHLCDLDCGVPLLLDRLRQSSASCKEAASFLKKRAQVEEDYARANLRIARTSLDSYREGDGKAGSYVTSYAAFLRTHELISDNHTRFAAQLNEIAEQLIELAKETEKARKSGKEMSARLDRTLSESEISMEKARVRFDTSVEDLERCLVAKAGESAKADPSLVPHASSSGFGSASGQGPPPKRTFGKAMSKLKSSSKNISAGSKTEDELRRRMADASEAYQREVQSCQSIRREHWVNHVPRMIRSLKENVDEVDNGTHFHLSKYAYLYEHLLLQDGINICPPGGIEDGPGLKAVVEAIDNRDDFRKYMEHYHVVWQQSPAGLKGPAKRGEDMLDKDGYVAVPSPTGGLARPLSTLTLSSLAPLPNVPDKRSFGISLDDLMSRDNLEVPRILEECVSVIEAHGIDCTGIYRISGTTSKIQRLKAALDADVDRVDLSSEEYLSDINNVTGVLKLWFRELPEPLMTFDLYSQFIEAAKIDNDRLRHIRLHERVNALPDAHYATLKFLMGHLDKVQQRQADNSMGISNLAIVFGPTLFRPPLGDESRQLDDMPWQCKVIETILGHYEAIFVPSEEEV